VNRAIGQIKDGQLIYSTYFLGSQAIVHLVGATLVVAQYAPLLCVYESHVWFCPFPPSRPYRPTRTGVRYNGMPGLGVITCQINKFSKIG